MPIVTKTTKIYKGQCPECSYETRETENKEEASTDLARHKKSRHSAEARKARAEEGRKTVEQLRKEGYVK